MLFHHQEEKNITLYAENIRCFEIKKELEQKDGCKTMYDLDQSDLKVCNHNGRYSIEVLFQPNLGLEL